MCAFAGDVVPISVVIGGCLCVRACTGDVKMCRVVCT